MFCYLTGITYYDNYYTFLCVYIFAIAFCRMTRLKAKMRMAMMRMAMVRMTLMRMTVITKTKIKTTVFL